MRLQVDLNPCRAGWGPCVHGYAHDCERGGGHDGRHRCGVCGATAVDRPKMWEQAAQFDGSSEGADHA